VGLLCLIPVLLAAALASCSEERADRPAPSPLATEPLPGGGRLELHAVQDAGGPCIVIRGLAGGPRACGRAPSERVPAVHRPVSAGPIVRRSADSPVELYGETGPRVTQVIVRYTGSGRRERTVRATLARATDPRSLAAARIRRPFGYFVATVPGTTRRAWADARSASGHLLGTADFSRLLADRHPTTVFLQRQQP
jgi:hypothetical protein